MNDLITFSPSPKNGRSYATESSTPCTLELHQETTNSNLKSRSGFMWNLTWTLSYCLQVPGSSDKISYFFRFFRTFRKKICGFEILGSFWLLPSC